MNEEQRKKVIKETFNSVSGEYDSNPLRFFPESARHLASILHLRGDERVIDIATGTGNAAFMLASHLPHGHVTGVDFSSGMLEKAREKAALLEVRNLTFVEMDMQAMNFKPDQFDAAICAFGIFFIDDMDAQLSRITRIVKPGGTIAICNFTENYFTPLRDLMTNRLLRYNVQLPPQTWKRIANQAGCRELFNKAGIDAVVVEQKNMGYFLADEIEWWDVIWNAGFRRLVTQLPASDLEQFRQEHLQEVATLKTKDGIWLDIGVLYTTGRNNNTQEINQ